MSAPEKGTRDSTQVLPITHGDKAPGHDGFNTARFFVEQAHVAWALLVLILLWGAYGYLSMPQRMDPDIPMRVAAVLCSWPGARAEKVEERITRRIEEAVAQNAKVDRIESTVRSGLSVSIVKLVDEADDPQKIFDDIGMRLTGVGDLPEGAGPVNFIKDFGDTSTLMLAVTGPKVSEVETELRAGELARTLADLRWGVDSDRPRMALALVAPQNLASEEIARKLDLLAAWLMAEGLARDVRTSARPGLAVLDAGTDLDGEGLRRAASRFASERLGSGGLHPDLWDAATLRDPEQARESLARVAGDRYGWRELEAFTDVLRRRLSAVPTVSKVGRWGVRPEAVFLEYSQERALPMELTPSGLRNLLAGRSTALPGGFVETDGRNLLVDPSGEFRSEKDLGGVLIPGPDGTSPAHVRDLADTRRAYVEPAENLNFYTSRDSFGNFVRTKAVTLSVEMRAGRQIQEFSRQADQALAEVRALLPEDVRVVRTSDQPHLVRDKVNLFMGSLYEAVILVVAVAFVGFREWRSAMLMALSIPLTLAMTFGLMHLLRLDLQQISISSLILALGLLVDDPVVAGDAIKREMAAGVPRAMAAWLGPTKLAKAILYATITNIVAYLPFLILTGDTGRYLYCLPIVVTAALVASRLVSMTFIPLLGDFLLRPPARPEPTAEERRSTGFGGFYHRLGALLIDHRRKALVVAVALAVSGFWLQAQLKPQFFPIDLSALSYLDIWLPEDASIQATERTVRLAEEAVADAVREMEGSRREMDPSAPPILKAMTSFVGGGGPRFWLSFTPELNQPNYAQVLLETTDKRLTEELVGPVQAALSAQVPGARVDVRRLESGPPIGVPVQVRLYGEDIPAMRREGERIKAVFLADPEVARLRDNWGAESFRARLSIDPDKASLAGLSNLDVARSALAAAMGEQVATINEGRLRIPVVARLRPDERATADDMGRLYVAGASGVRVPLAQVADLHYGMETEKVTRRNQFRCLTVSCFAAQGVLPSVIVERAWPRIQAVQASLPPGMRLELGGEYEEQVKGFDELALVMAVSVLGIYMALLFQFRNAVKPLIVFAAVPFGMAGSAATLWVMGQPFGFMAFLGVASLIGVIVSHIIVLFDFIEEKREHGQDLRTALLDAGVMRLRPVLITVGATVIALFPLARSGGPLWEPLCYAQIGGLTAATVVTLLIVPVLYAIAVLDLKIVK